MTKKTKKTTTTTKKKKKRKKTLRDYRVARNLELHKH